MATQPTTQPTTPKVPPPTTQEYDDAYQYLLMDPNFTDKPDHNAAVRAFAQDVGMFEDKEVDAINQQVKEFAEKYASVKKIKAFVDGFKNTLSEKLPMIGKAKCLVDHANGKEFGEAIKAINTFVQTMKFSVEREITGNYPTGVKISLRIVEQDNAEDAVLFALAHEVGHTVNLLLNPYNPKDARFPTVYKALLPPLPEGTTGPHQLEYFADSFGAVFLVHGLAMDVKKVPGATQFLFAEEAEGKEHPSGELRIAKVRETLEKRC